MRFAGVVILYHPDEDLYHRILTYLGILEKLYIFDNTETFNHTFYNKVSANEKIKYFHDQENKGIAVRLNQAALLALQDGFSFLLTMDQDSNFNGNEAEHYQNCILHLIEIDKVAMAGLEFTRPISNANCSYERVSELITSGSVVNLNLFEVIGGFDENLFIDYVDHEYCYRAKVKGYEVLKFTHIFLQHSVGEASNKRSLITLKSSPRSFHSPTRIYYMVRNFLYVNKKYKATFATELHQQRNSILTRIKNKFLYNNGRIKLIKLIFRAFKDYSNNKMGKSTFD